MKIELVTHCWAQKYPHYAAALHYQLSSLILHPSKNCDVSVSVCFYWEDDAVLKVLNRFESRLSIKRIMVEDLGLLGRRAYGRNLAALSNNADILWFSDVDQVYREGCFDQLVDIPWPDAASMVFPCIIRIHKNHQTGDAALARVGDVPIDIDPTEFTEKHYFKAIGGVQIVRGSYGRKHGYLHGFNKWQCPVKNPFADFRDDIAFRTVCREHGLISPVDIHGVYRLRHSSTTH